MLLRIIARNVGVSAVLKLGSFLLQFSLLPVLIRELGKAEFGVWVAMQSLVLWIVTLDFGISTGVRNKLVEAISLGQHEKARGYVSSAFYGQVGLWGVVSLVALGLLTGLKLPWNEWMNSTVSNADLSLALFFCFFTFAFNLCCSVVNGVLYAHHWNGLTGVVGVTASLGLLLYVLAMRSLGYEISLPSLAFANFRTFMIAQCFLAAYVFGVFRDLRPRWEDFSVDAFREVVQLGIQFLVVELTFLILFVMDRWIVLKTLGPEAVTDYEVVMRISSIVTTGFSLVVGPMWALSGEAWAKRDRKGMDRLWRIMMLAMLPFFAVAIALGLIINPLIHTVVDRTIQLSLLTSVAMVAYCIVVVWSNAYAGLLNGIGRIREQMICSLFACAINIPLAFCLCRSPGVGIAGALLGTWVALLLFAIVAPFVWINCRNSCES